MGFCANTSCGKKLANKRDLKEMNKRGVFTPDQIQKECDKAWSEVNPDDKTIISMMEC